MGISTHVIGFRPPDEKWQKMKAAWDACEAAGAEIPKAVLAFFGHTHPDPAGVEVEIEAKEWDHDGASGYEIEVDKLPKDIKTIRFFNAW
jgi:hypothetical protein